MKFYIANNAFSGLSSGEIMTMLDNWFTFTYTNINGYNAPARADESHILPIANPGDKWKGNGVTNPNAALYTLDYSMTAKCYKECMEPGYFPATTPGTGLVPDAYGPSEATISTATMTYPLKPTTILNNWPLNNPTLGSLPRSLFNDAAQAVGAFPYPTAYAGANQTISFAGYLDEPYCYHMRRRDHAHRLHHSYLYLDLRERPGRPDYHHSERPDHYRYRSDGPG
ncbi:MAG: hypothetical protein QM765_44570 [Myxococcales bacterium]